MVTFRDQHVDPEASTPKFLISEATIASHPRQLPTDKSGGFVTQKGEFWIDLAESLMTLMPSVDYDFEHKITVTSPPAPSPLHPSRPPTSRPTPPIPLTPLCQVTTKKSMDWMGGHERLHVPQADLKVRTCTLSSRVLLSCRHLHLICASAHFCPPHPYPSPLPLSLAILPCHARRR